VAHSFLSPHHRLLHDGKRTRRHTLALGWSFKYEADEFSGRLVGERIARHIGKDFRGLSLADAYPPDALPWVTTLLHRAVREPALYAQSGPLFHQAHAGERILLPLSEDGIVADGVLGATVLHEATSMPLTLVAPDPKTERWFSIPC
jgi:hypothetical protein